MKPFIAIFTLLAIAMSASHAQTRATITGKVTDSLSHNALPLATVAVVNLADSSLVSYTTTTKNGEFIIRNLPPEQNYKVVVSFVGYDNARRRVKLVKGETLNLNNIGLHPANDLKEVVIRGERQPITIHADTIEFSTEAFKTRPNAVVEDLLKKLPGIQVDVDGTITVNGKNVKKILIDGKEFFTGDIKIASQNLNADLIDKVQVFDDRENDPNHLIDVSQVDKIINLKLKKAIKKSTFGKLYAGAGTDDRYESGGLLNLFRDTLQVSLIGFSNNVNRSAFSNGDLSSLGGFQRSGSPVGVSNLSTGGKSTGIQQIVTAGFNINQDYGKSLKLNLIYFYSHTNDLYHSAIHNQQFIRDTTLLTNTLVDHTLGQSKHLISALMLFKPNAQNSIRYAPGIVFTDDQQNANGTIGTGNNFQPALSQSIDGQQQDHTQVQFQHTLLYIHLFKTKGETLTISHNLQFNPDKTNTYSLFNYTYYVPVNKTAVLDQAVYKNANRSYGDLNMNYRRLFGQKITADLILFNSYENNSDSLGTYKLNTATGNYDLYQLNQSDNLTRGLWTSYLQTRIGLSLSKTTSITGSLSAQWQHIHTAFSNAVNYTDQEYLNLLPSLRLSARNFSLNLERSIKQPTISQLQPVVSTNDPTYTYIGNPNLKPATVNNIYANYTNFKAASQAGYTFFMNGSITESSTITSRTINSNGTQTLSPVNNDGDYLITLGGNFNKRFKKTGDWSFRSQIGLNSSLSKSAFLLNNVKSADNNLAISINNESGISWRQVDLNASYVISGNYSHFTDGASQDINWTRQNLTTQLLVHWPKKIVFEGNYNYIYNPQVSSVFQTSSNILNASISLLMLKKDQAQLKITGFDLLNQNTGITSMSNENGITDQTNLVLKRYFMLSLIFNFNQTIVKK